MPKVEKVCQKMRKYAKSCKSLRQCEEVRKCVKTRESVTNLQRVCQKLRKWAKVEKAWESVPKTVWNCEKGVTKDVKCDKQW